MTWLKTSDRFYSEPVIADLGFEVAGFHLTAMNFCADRLSDGYITEADVDYLARLYRCTTVASLIDKLLKAQLWERVDSGYRIIDLLADQPSRVQVLEQREKNRRDVADWRASHKPSKDVTSYKPVSNRPVRVRYGPGKNTERGSGLHATNGAQATKQATRQPSTPHSGSSPKLSEAQHEADDRLIDADVAEARRDLLRRARLHDLARQPVKGLRLVQQ